MSMSGTAFNRWPGGGSQRTLMVQRHLDDLPATSSPWRGNELVDPNVVHYGRYGDDRWRFGAQAPNQRASACDVRWQPAVDGGRWPDQVWMTIGRDLGMALYGRRPDQPHSRTRGHKPATVFGYLAKLSAIARWAVTADLGTPDCWDETIGPRLLADLHANKVPRNGTGQMSTPTARGYLNMLANLWLHRTHIGHGPSAPPWPQFASVSGAELAAGDVRPTLMPHVETEVVDPAVWWALVRFALRFVLVYGDDLLPAWDTYLASRLPRGQSATGRRHRGPHTVALLEQFAAQPDRLVPVDGDGTPVLRQLCAAVGLDDAAFQPSKNPAHADTCRVILTRMASDGRTTRYWFGPPVREIRQADGTLKPWVDHLDTTNIVELVGKLRDACYLLIAALGALRDSEIQGLTRGCVSVADGGWALDGHIIKGNDAPTAARWWIDPLVARCITTLERLGGHIEVVEQTAGAWGPSDRLLFKLTNHRFGQAGIGPGAKTMASLIGWINANADTLDLPRATTDPAAPAIPVTVTPHQLRTTFAAVAAMEPDGPLGVARQLHDSFTLASAYMANRDRKWFEVHRDHHNQVTLSRLHGYLAGGLDTLVGPGATGLAADLHVATDDAAQLADVNDHHDGYRTLIGQLLTAAGRSFGCSNLSHCRGKPSDARCATIFGTLDPNTPFTPNFTADVCFGPSIDDDCRNVVYDPPDHLPVWDVALHAYQTERDQLDPGRHAARVELDRLIVATSQRIAAMEHASQLRPRQVLDRLIAEMERYLDYIRFDVDIPGAAAAYRHLYQAARRRALWLAAQMPEHDRPDLVVPAEVTS